MKLKDLQTSFFEKRNNLKLNVGPFSVSVTSDFDSVFLEIAKIYSEFELLDNDSFVDFEIHLNHTKSFWRKVFRPQCMFALGNNQPFTPIPANQAYPMFEWGLNWCISSNSHQYLIFHAAVIEKNGVCVVMPAPPGSGKSTLTALLAYSGWRLLSDELTLVNKNSGEIQPLARPINLKNQSIKVVKQAFPNAIHSEVVKDTHKGDVCLFKAPDYATKNIHKTARATHVIFPKYKANTTIEEQILSQEEVFFSLIENSFNYNVLGLQGFHTMTDLVDGIQGFNFTYGDNDTAISWFEGLSK